MPQRLWAKCCIFNAYFVLQWIHDICVSSGTKTFTSDAFIDDIAKGFSSRSQAALQTFGKHHAERHRTPATDSPSVPTRPVHKHPKSQGYVIWFGGPAQSWPQPGTREEIQAKIIKNKKHTAVVGLSTLKTTKKNGMSLNAQKGRWPNVSQCDTNKFIPRF